MKKKKLDIIYEDKEILVVNKPINLLTVSTFREKEKTLFHEVYTYIKQKNKSNKIFVVHRLDRETSGLVLFAKSEELKYKLQENWDKLVIERKYLAITEGKPIKKEDKLEDYLTENSAFNVFVTKNKSIGKLAITKYKVLSENKSFCLMDIEILTGRKNQIRVQLSNINCPILGDKKYGSKLNPIKRLGLHAYKLKLIHPNTKKEMLFETKIPKEFSLMFPQK